MTRELDEAGRAQKALGLLNEARAADPTGLPHALVHLCYYARYHAVAAALIRAYGSAPTIHKGSALLAE